MTLVSRPDLSQRTSLSKSALTTFDFCATKAWHEIRHRAPLIPAENITFGSALDAAVEIVISYLRMEQPADVDRAADAAAEVIARDATEVDPGEVRTAVARFLIDVAPQYDFRYAKTQATLRVPDLAGLGEAEGHPDVILADGRIYDVKSAKRAKDAHEATVELGFYAVLSEADTGEAVPWVGYWTWVRTQRPYWQTVAFAVTDELRRWTVEKAAAYMRAKRADAVLNAKSAEPVNYSFTSGPRNGSLCGTCQYAPVCALAYRGEASDDAA